MSRRIVFESSAFTDFNEWAKLDKKIYRKIVELIKDIDRSPFEGLGKPEPLKYELNGFWSRRIDSEHRLVYQVSDEEIAIVNVPMENFPLVAARLSIFNACKIVEVYSSANKIRHEY